MLRWAITFAILALIAGVLGFGGLAGDFSYIAQIRQTQEHRQSRPESRK